MNEQQSETIFVQDITSIHRWIRCLAVVSFDINQGQKVDLIIPTEQLSVQAEKQLAMLAFPDSNTLGDNEGIFKYTFRNTNGYFGFTCFKQKKDPQNPRGYSQKSLVILSQLPFLVFFQKITQFLVFKCFNDHSTIKQTLICLCKQITKWPDPEPLKSYILPVLDYEITIEIPNYALRYQNSPIPYRNVSPYHQQQQQNVQFSLEQVLTKQSILRSGLFQQVKLIQHYGKCLQALWTVWYMTLTNQSYLLMSDNPYTASQAVLGAISIISPLIYVGGFHPYVTVYDPQLNSLQVQTKNHISGATNPLFSKLFTKIQIINLNSTFKSRKSLLPVKQLCIKSTSEEHRAINQAAIRKYFYRLNQNLIGIFDSYLCLQKNDLKFFNKKEFMRHAKNRKDFQGLEYAFDGKKYLYGFFQQFLESSNFTLFLKKRNVMITTEDK